MAAPKPGGFKMSLGGLKGKVGLKGASNRTEVKKPRPSLLGDDEPEDTNKQQEISGWDAAEGGAVDAAGKKEKEAPRIIPALPNRNWAEEARRKQLANAPHVQAQNAVPEENMQEPEMKFGLTILKKEEPEENGAEEETAPPEPMEDVQDNLTEEQRLEKKALDALLSGKTADQELVIPVRTEEEALREDVRKAPEAPTLAAYEATPIEGFGAALLRGMGWKDGEAIGKNGAISKPKEIKRRPALLGIGAKAESAPGVELGEWVGSKAKGKAAAQGYNPLTLRNKVTGELITEEELKAKIEQQELVKDEKPAKERRNYSDDEEDDRRREKRRERRDDRDRRRDDDYSSGSRRDRDRYDDRRRDRDDDHYDSERRREKRKDKYREEDYDSERRREKRRDREDDYDSERRSEKRKDRSRRDRSRSPDDDRREKRRDRYRSRSRDSEDRRKRRRDRDY